MNFKKMILAGDTIRLNVYKDVDHAQRDVNEPLDGQTYEVVEQDGKTGIISQNKFIALDDLGQMVGITRVNATPIDMEIDDFQKLYAPDPDEVITPAENLCRSLLRAQISSMSAVEGDDDDGGTCNFDAPVIDFAAIGLEKSEAEKIIHDVGLNCFDWKPFKDHREDGKLVKAPTYLVVTGFQRGQGNMRTRMSEAFCEKLNADGVESGMYYQMD